VSDTPAERQEAARTRRRWITLAEFVAVAGLAVTALGFWTNWSDRRADQADKVATTAAEARKDARLDVTATVRDDGRSLLLADARHDIQDVRFAFPATLGVAGQHPAGDPAIEADWIAAPLLRLTEGGADEKVGRLPVLATIRYWDGDAARTATAIYDVVWRTEGRFLKGRALRLEGLKLRRRGGTTADLDQLWDKPAR